MALHKTVEYDEGGRPRFHYIQDDPNVPVVLTGPISGPATVVHPDGTEFHYDASPEVIEVFPGHELLVADVIARRYEAEGHPSHDEEHPFVRTPVDLTHDVATGEQREEFIAAVEALVPSGLDSSPTAVIDHLTGAHRG